MFKKSHQTKGLTQPKFDSKLDALKGNFSREEDGEQDDGMEKTIWSYREEDRIIVEFL